MILKRYARRGSQNAYEAQKAGPATRQASSEARASQLQPTIAEIKAGGVTTLAGIAGELTVRGIPTASGKPIWSAVQVSRVIAKLCSNREAVSG